MCIIAVYNKESKPNKQTLEFMIKGNPDGVGVAWNDGKQVHFIKGLATAEAVLSIYEKVKKDALQFVFHARIATSGGISAQKCHPFLLASNNTALDITEYKGKRPCIFHNGVFSLKAEDGLNDTQTLVKTMIAPLYEADAYGLYNGNFNDLIEFLTRGSRFVIMHPDKVQLFGDWKKEDGVLYSNSNYKPRQYGFYKGFKEDANERARFIRYLDEGSLCGWY